MHTVAELERMLRLSSLEGCMLGINNRDLQVGVQACYSLGAWLPRQHQPVQVALGQCMNPATFGRLYCALHGATLAAHAVQLVVCGAASRHVVRSVVLETRQIEHTSKHHAHADVQGGPCQHQADYGVSRWPAGVCAPLAQ